MFTGLIQAVGRVSRRGDGLVVLGCEPFSPLALGDSVAVDGVCLTAELCSGGFLADVSEETLARTNLGEKARQEKKVNLEPALRLSDRLGGHIVSGHVDGLGQVISIVKNTNSWDLEVRWQKPQLGRYTCEKASVSIDGISLTVAGCSEKGARFWIAVIPHTWTNTSLKELESGALLNLEADLMAKYAESLIGELNLKGSIGISKPQDEVSRTWLANNGWT